ncbi:MAG: Rieske 2Fe-2S domain-containing protein [Bacteroidia bacterium]|nr:Rieske 2Fe-2S domain-containing protein [Bacteroidia bacterium]
MPLKFYKVYDFKKDGAQPQAIQSVRTINLDGTLLTMIRLPEGYFAVADQCPHAGARLGHGKCTPEGKIICPVHRFQYDVKTGRGLPAQGDYVETYPVETRKDGVYVGLKSKWWKIF